MNEPTIEANVSAGANRNGASANITSVIIVNQASANQSQCQSRSQCQCQCQCQCQSQSQSLLKCDTCNYHLRLRRIEKKMLQMFPISISMLLLQAHLILLLSLSSLLLIASSAANAGSLSTSPSSSLSNKELVLHTSAHITPISQRQVPEINSNNVAAINHRHRRHNRRSQSHNHNLNRSSLNNQRENTESAHLSHNNNNHHDNEHPQKQRQPEQHHWTSDESNNREDGTRIGDLLQDNSRADSVDSAESALIDSDSDLHEQQANEIDSLAAIASATKEGQHQPNSLEATRTPNMNELRSIARNVTALEGQSVVFDCDVGQSTGVAGDKLVTWLRLRDLQVLTIGNQTWTPEERFSVRHTASDASNWALKIKNVEKTTDVSIYECQVSNEPERSQYYALQVIEPRAKFLHSKTDVILNQSDTVNLTCIIEHAGASDDGTHLYVFWYKNNQALSYGSTQQAVAGPTETAGGGGGRGGARRGTHITQVSLEPSAGEPDTLVARLIISNASADDSGNYTCAPSHARAASVMVHVSQGEKRTSAASYQNEDQPHDTMVGESLANAPSSSGASGTPRVTVQEILGKNQAYVTFVAVVVLIAWFNVVFHVPTACGLLAVGTVLGVFIGKLTDHDDHGQHDKGGGDANNDDSESQNSKNSFSNEHSNEHTLLKLLTDDTKSSSSTSGDGEYHHRPHSLVTTSTTKTTTATTTTTTTELQPPNSSECSTSANSSSGLLGCANPSSFCASSSAAAMLRVRLLDSSPRPQRAAAVAQPTHNVLSQCICSHSRRASVSTAEPMLTTDEGLTSSSTTSSSTTSLSRQLRHASDHVPSYNSSIILKQQRTNDNNSSAIDKHVIEELELCQFRPQSLETAAAQQQQQQHHHHHHHHLIIEATDNVPGIAPGSSPASSPASSAGTSGVSSSTDYALDQRPSIAQSRVNNMQKLAACGQLTLELQLDEALAALSNAIDTTTQPIKSTAATLANTTRSSTMYKNNTQHHRNLCLDKSEMPHLCIINESTDLCENQSLVMSLDQPFHCSKHLSSCNVNEKQREQPCGDPNSSIEARLTTLKSLVGTIADAQTLRAASSAAQYQEKQHKATDVSAQR